MNNRRTKESSTQTRSNRSVFKKMVALMLTLCMMFTMVPAMAMEEGNPAPDVGTVLDNSLEGGVDALETPADDKSDENNTSEGSGSLDTTGNSGEGTNNGEEEKKDSVGNEENSPNSKQTDDPELNDSEEQTGNSEAEAAAKKLAEEEAAKKLAAEEAAKKLAEEEAAKKLAAEEAAKKLAEEEAAKKLAEEEAAKKAAEEEAARLAEEEAARLAAETPSNSSSSSSLMAVAPMSINPGRGTFTVTVNVEKDGVAWDDHGKSFKLVDTTGFGTAVDITMASAAVNGNVVTFTFQDAMFANYALYVGDVAIPGATANLSNMSEATSAEFTVNYYTVTFDPAGGNWDGDDDSKEYVLLTGGKATVPLDPRKEGHTFTGWSDGSEAGDQVDAATVTLTAGWEENSVLYNVTFYKNFTGEPSWSHERLTVEAGATVTLPTAPPVRTGYSFIGWATSDTALVANFDATTAVTDNTHLFAVWQPIVYRTVTFNPDYTTGGGMGSSGTPAPSTTVQVEDGKAVPMQPNPTRTNYNFLYWYKDGETTAYDFSTPITADVTLKAKWELTWYSYTINYNLDGGSWVTGYTPTTAAANTASVTLPAADKLTKTVDGTEYVLDAWEVRSGNQTPYTWTDAPTVSSTNGYNSYGTVTVYVRATWEPKTTTPETYTITFDANGGSWGVGGGDPITSQDFDVNHGSAITQPATNPEWLNYRFQGWQTEAGDALDSGTTEATEDITYFAQWKEIYTVTFNPNGGQWMAGGNLSAPREKKVDDGEILASNFLTDLSRDGYDFLGWSTDDEATTPDFFSDTPVTAETELYAVWQIKTITITFDAAALDAEGDTSPISGNYGTSVTLPTLTRDDYNFLGWSEDGEEPAEPSSYTLTTNLELTAIWEEIVYVTVTFNGNGGSWWSNFTSTTTQQVSVAAGGKVTPPSNPSQMGQRFLGWSDKQSEAVTSYFDASATPVTAPITLYARWAANNSSYAINYNLDGGSWVTGFTPTTAAANTATVTLPVDKLTKTVDGIEYVVDAWEVRSGNQTPYTWTDATTVSSTNGYNSYGTVTVYVRATWEPKPATPIDTTPPTLVSKVYYVQGEDGLEVVTEDVPVNKDITVVITASEDIQLPEGDDWAYQGAAKNVITRTFTRAAGSENREIHSFYLKELNGLLESEEHVGVIANIDKKAPTGTATYGAVVEGAVVVTITADDEITAVGWDQDATNTNIITKTYTANTTETVEITDDAGNKGSVSVVVDSIPVLVEEDFDVRLTVNLGAGTWNLHGKTFTLRSEDNTVSPSSNSNGAEMPFLISDFAGTVYELYDGSTPTGVKVTLDSISGVEEISVQYYQVTFNKVTTSTENASWSYGPQYVLAGKTVTMPTTNPADYTTGSGIWTSTNRFLGWSENQYTTPIVYYTGSAAVTTTTILYARFSTSTTYTITFNLGEGGGWVNYTPPTRFTNNSTFTLPTAANVAKEGHEFTGWEILGEGGAYTDVTGSSITVRSNVTLCAKWTAISTPPGPDDPDPDTDAPTITLTLSDGYVSEEWTNDDVTATVVSDEPIKLDSIPAGWTVVDEYTIEKEFSTTTELSITREVTLQDLSGNDSNKVEFTVKIDKVAPEGVATYDEEDPTQGPVIVTITAGEPITADDWTSADNTVWKSFSANTGVQTLTITDRAGNEGQVDYEVANIDTDAPTGSITYSGTYVAGAWTNQNVTVTLTVGEVVEITAEAEAALWTTTDSKVFTRVLSSSGQYSGSFKVKDAAGNQSAIITYSVKIDKDKPALIVYYNGMPLTLSTYQAHDSVIVTASADKGTGSDIVKIEYSTNGGAAWTTYSGAITAGDGANISIRALDKAGNYSDVNGTNFIVYLQPVGSGVTKEFTLGSSTDVEEEITLNHNGLNAVYGHGAVYMKDYTAVGNKVTLRASFLNTLAPSDTPYEFSVSYYQHPLIGGADSGTHTPQNTTFKVLVKGAAQNTLAVTAATPQTYAPGKTVALDTTGGSGTGAVTYELVGASNCGTLSGSTITITGVGTITVKATKAAQGIYAAATSAPFTITVNKGTRAFEIVGPAEPVLANVGTFDLTTNPVLEGVSYSLTPFTQSCGWVTSGGRVTLTGAGKVYVTAVKAADSLYEAASDTIEIDVVKANQAPLTIQNPGSKTFGDAPFWMSATGGSTPNTPVMSLKAGSKGTQGSYQFTNLVTITGAGTITIVATKAGNAFYNDVSAELTINVAKGKQAELTVDNVLGLKYGVNDDFTLTVDGGSTGGQVTYELVGLGNCGTLSGNKVTITGAGEIKVKATMAGNDNYKPETSKVRTITVAKGDQTALTVDDPGEKTYSPNGTFTLTTSGGTGNGAVSFELVGQTDVATLNENGTVTIKNAGTFTVIAKKAASSDGNYKAATSAPRTITIGKADQAALTISAPSEKTFGNAPFQVGASGGSNTG
ncbi:MAG: InlB B-repeat-containing protein, partial [Oscillospiraceae bacterium]|nr:InlB B-repeat-containing protein [Oscillospiraceae bacterium]